MILTTLYTNTLPPLQKLPIELVLALILVIDICNKLQVLVIDICNKLHYNNNAVLQKVELWLAKSVPFYRAFYPK